MANNLFYVAVSVLIAFSISCLYNPGKSIMDELDQMDEMLIYSMPSYRRRQKPEKRSNLRNGRNPPIYRVNSHRKVTFGRISRSRERVSTRYLAKRSLSL
ncbi:hypothetical protein CC79DRAFT_189773 [Sarocladium strictum]